MLCFKEVAVALGATERTRTKSRFIAYLCVLSNN